MSILPSSSNTSLTTYTAITDLITQISQTFSGVTDASGNIDLEADQEIRVGSESISFDATNLRPVFSSLDATTSITLDGDLVVSAATIASALTAVDGNIEGDCEMPDAAWESVKSSYADNEVALVSLSSYSAPAASECKLYISGFTDFKIGRREADGKATYSIIADYSEL